MYGVEEGRGEGPRCSLSTWEIRELRVDVIWMKGRSRGCTKVDKWQRKLRTCGRT